MVSDRNLCYTWKRLQKFHTGHNYCSQSYQIPRPFLYGYQFRSNCQITRKVHVASDTTNLSFLQFYFNFCSKFLSVYLSILSKKRSNETERMREGKRSNYHGQSVLKYRSSEQFREFLGTRKGIGSVGSCGLLNPTGNNER